MFSGGKVFWALLHPTKCEFWKHLCGMFWSSWEYGFVSWWFHMWENMTTLLATRLIPIKNGDDFCFSIVTRDLRGFIYCTQEKNDLFGSDNGLCYAHKNDNHCGSRGSAFLAKSHIWDWATPSKSSDSSNEHPSHLPFSNQTRCAADP